MSPSNGPYGREAHAERRASRRAAAITEVGLLEAQRARCAEGDHDIATVPADRRVFAPEWAVAPDADRRLPTGTIYCRCCGAVHR